MDIAKRLLTSREAAKYLGISERTLFTLRKRGELHSLNVSHRGRRFDIIDLQDLIDRRKRVASNGSIDTMDNDADWDEDELIDPDDESK